jgi:hypothetical protein
MNKNQNESMQDSEENAAPSISCRWRSSDYKSGIEEGWVLDVHVPFYGFQSFPIPDPLELIAANLNRVCMDSAGLERKDVTSAFDVEALVIQVQQHIAEDYCDDGFECEGPISSQDGAEQFDYWEHVHGVAAASRESTHALSMWLRVEIAASVLQEGRVEKDD